MLGGMRKLSGSLLVQDAPNLRLTPIERLTAADLPVWDCSRDEVVWTTPPTDAQQAEATRLLGHPVRHTTTLPKQ